jgi:hypothetical protein
MEDIMNNFDKQRIENAIWILEQYDYEIRQIAKERDFHSWDCEKVFDILAEVKEQLRQ